MSVGLLVSGGTVGLMFEEFSLGFGAPAWGVCSSGSGTGLQDFLRPSAVLLLLPLPRLML